MKKLFLFISCLFAGLFLTVSCIDDAKEKGLRSLAENEIAFVIGDASTRAGESQASVEGVTIPLGVKTDDGELAFIETIECLDGSPATRGIPAYTENVATLYGQFDAHVYNADIPDAVYSVGNDGTWSKTYDDNPWDKANPIKFWMNMPVADEMTSVDTLDFDSESEKITFSYESPATAADQKDILFTTKTISRDAYKSGDNKLIFYHALTGVKFAIGNQTNETKITKIEFVGLKDSGRCKVAYVAGAKSAACVEWSNLYKVNESIYQGFDGSVVNFDEDDAAFGDSFYDAACQNNINDEDASLTFWLVPQTLSAAVKLNVTFTINGIEHTQAIAFGDKLKPEGGSYPTWQAGELRTYTLTSNEVDIIIEDKVDDGVKSDVEITNTGNVDCYVRATIVGFWCDGKGKIVDYWRLNSISDADDYDAGFVGLPGDNWVRGESNIFYYTGVVKPGLQPGQNAAGDDVDILFTSYTEPSAPSTYPTARLKMSVMVQAISASGYNDYQSAWSAAAGVNFPSTSN